MHVSNKLAASIRNTLPELRVSWITLLNFTMTVPSLPTAQSVYPSDAVTSHAELIKFLEFQQKQIESLERSMRDLRSAYNLLCGSGYLKP